MNQIIDIVAIEGASVVDVESVPLVVVVDVYAGGDTAALQAQITALEARVAALEAEEYNMQTYFLISGQY